MAFPGRISLLLFLIMVSDLNKLLKFPHALFYTDDTTVMITGQNLRFMCIKINEDLESLKGQWLIENKLTLNI